MNRATRNTPVWFDLCLVGVFFALIFHLRDRDIEYVLDPDFSSATISVWREFLGTGRLGTLPIPYAHPYLDASYVLYALMAKLIRAVVIPVPSVSALFPSRDAYNIAAALLTNSLAYATACWFFYRMMLRLTGSIALASCLALLFCISPPMLEINRVRVDYLMILPVIILFSGGLILARREETTFDAVTLAVALAVASTIKLNGCAFLAFLAIGLGVRWLSGRLDLQPRHVAWFAGIFVLCFVPLMIRYWAYLSPLGIITVLWGGVRSVMQWSHVFRLPASYYAVDLFLGHGLPMVILYLVASAFVVGQAVVRRDEASLYLAMAFLLFSGLGLVVLRYERGGYHLLPIYLANIGLAITTLWRVATPRLVARALAAVAAAVVVFSLAPAGAHYLQVAHDAEAQMVAVEQTRRAPRRWLKEHAAAGSRVCVYAGSKWANPPITDLPLTMTDSPFAFPYLDKVSMAKFEPPSLSTVRSLCDVVVLNDFHINFYDQVMQEASPMEAARWRDFRRDLQATYPPQVFHSETPAYSVSRIEIYAMR